MSKTPMPRDRSRMKVHWFVVACAFFGIVLGSAWSIYMEVPRGGGLLGCLAGIAIGEGLLRLARKIRK
ncbi:MAG: hypothetical protein Q4D38_10515 [Planctomycetia bacterium]|nr:hypothetical protein [Planctomycetia bacterium]